MKDRLASDITSLPKPAKTNQALTSMLLSVLISFRDSSLDLKAPFVHLLGRLKAKVSNTFLNNQQSPAKAFMVTTEEYILFSPQTSRIAL